MAENTAKRWTLSAFAATGFLLAGVIFYYKNNPPPHKPLVPIAGPAVDGQGDVNDYNPRGVVRPFRPITDAPFAKADEIGDRVTDNELVLGVEIAGQARAYPINMLCGPQREIINDTVGNRAIAATW